MQSCLHQHTSHTGVRRRHPGNSGEPLWREAADGKREPAAARRFSADRRRGRHAGACLRCATQQCRYIRPEDVSIAQPLSKLYAGTRAASGRLRPAAVPRNRYPAARSAVRAILRSPVEQIGLWEAQLWRPVSRDWRRWPPVRLARAGPAPAGPARVCLPLIPIAGFAAALVAAAQSRAAIHGPWTTAAGSLFVVSATRWRRPPRSTARRAHCRPR